MSKQVNKVKPKLNDTLYNSNKIIEARYKLDKTEMKLIRCFMSLLNQDDEDFKLYSMQISDLKHFLVDNNKKQGAFEKRIKRSLESIMKKPFWVKISSDEEKLFHWLENPSIKAKKGEITFKFNNELKPFFLDLIRGGNYTSYKLLNLVNLNSKYSIRIYELLKQYQKIGIRKFLLADLKIILAQNEDGSDCYPRYPDFKRNVILPAYRELPEKTDISFEFEEIRSGRKVEAINFIISMQTPPEVIPINPSLKPENSKSVSSQLYLEVKDKNPLVTKIIELTGATRVFAEEVIENPFKNLSATAQLEMESMPITKEEYVEEKLALTKQNASENPAGFFRNALAQNWKSKELKKDIKKQLKLKERRATEQSIIRLEKKRDGLSLKINQELKSFVLKINEEEADFLEVNLPKVVSEKNLRNFYKPKLSALENYLDNRMIQAVFDAYVCKEYRHIEIIKQIAVTYQPLLQKIGQQVDDLKAGRTVNQRSIF